MASVDQSYSSCLDILTLRTALISIIFINIIRSQTNYFNANTSSQWENQIINCTDNDKPCTITCDEQYSCRYSTIICPSQSPCTVNCTEYYSCIESTIDCPEHSQCDISCTASHSCKEITINPPENELLFSLIFTGHAALYGVTYPIYVVDEYSPFNLTCGYNYQCFEMNIICPKYSYCNIDCIRYGACSNVCYFYLMNVL